MGKPMVLFLCTGNSARSQMAEAFLRQHAGNIYDAHSAGLNPQGVHPLTIQVMQEVGIDISEHQSKSLTQYLGKASPKWVIFVCEKAESSCPHVWPFSLQSESWRFEDPVDSVGDDLERIMKFRSVRDQIETRILDWISKNKISSETENQFEFRE
ncbi:arsenate reductase ArsC [Gimesia maris]|uniref:Arsenate-mycothiol transferase ArsC2 n=2 Tax=Gimesia maris TaxID=122 RepID=A0ABX5YRJ8_9PLAN|nr:arsenate reductase ArsC [Gimesia maris]EDL62089.1 phosphotyrosine protein phosphatase [Gimesia maris DSM 8797]QDU16323.1 Arsenate-mycothiol transferase ArsC2 [Gimesia maris]QEG18370.1 Arsenate-mycothiol transferase ArsC2 [Gimesia maris]QGQ28644.1 arsenate reductase ArsC [Gimesia maris]